MTEDGSYRPEDDDLPEITDDTIGSVFIDKYGLAWACSYSDGANCYVWFPLGKA